MRKALAQAGFAPEQISHINAHAAGTPVGDVAEAHAIREVLSRATVTAPKAALGHLFGAAGAIEALIAILSVEHGVIPPTRNLPAAGVGPDIDLDVVAERRDVPQEDARKKRIGRPTPPGTPSTPTCRRSFRRARACSRFRRTTVWTPVVRERLTGERKRWLQQLDDDTRWMVDRFSLPSVWPWGRH